MQTAKLQKRGNRVIHSRGLYEAQQNKEEIESFTVLPLRGKILNTYVEEVNSKRNGNPNDIKTKALSKMISSNEIVTLINALGLDPKAEEIDLDDLRYGKIIIMTDADVDGSHIRALLLTFFNNRPFNKLIENGNIFLAQPLFLK